MKDINSYIEDLLDENGEIPPFDPESVDIEKLQSDVATLFSDIFSGKAKRRRRRDGDQYEWQT